MKDSKDTATIEMFPGVTSLPESFVNHPKSVTELRSDWSGRASDWRPRDVLIALLREIDEGRQVDALVVVCADYHEDGSVRPHYTASSPNAIVSAGLFEWGKKMAMGDR
jgi:hypothetical protein